MQPCILIWVNEHKAAILRLVPSCTGRAVSHPTAPSHWAAQLTPSHTGPFRTWPCYCNGLCHTRPHSLHRVTSSGRTESHQAMSCRTWPHSRSGPGLAACAEAHRVVPCSTWPYSSHWAAPHRAVRPAQSRIMPHRFTPGLANPHHI